MPKGIIYKFTAPDGAIYVGQTKNIQLRLEKWLDKTGYSKGMIGQHRKKYAPEEWTYEVVELVERHHKEELEIALNRKETFWIGYYTKTAEDNRINILNIDLGGSGSKIRDNDANLIEDYVNNVVLSNRTNRFKDHQDNLFGLVDCFNENGMYVRTGTLSQLSNHNKSKRNIIQSCNDHSWLGYTTYRRHGQYASVEPCPYKPKRKDSYYKPKKELLRIYNARTKELIAIVKNYIAATNYVGADTGKISAVVNGSKEQYNGFIIKRGSIPPTDEEYKAAVYKADMPR